MAPEFSDIPLLDQSQICEIYAPGDDPEVAAMQSEIWSGIRSDLENDLRSLTAGPELKAGLHRIRGYAATSGLLRLAAVLEKWEKEENSDDLLLSHLPVALAVCTESIAEIEAAFPHIAPGRPGGVP